MFLGQPGRPDRIRAVVVILMVVGDPPPFPFMSCDVEHARPCLFLQFWCDGLNEETEKMQVLPVCSVLRDEYIKPGHHVAAAVSLLSGSLHNLAATGNF